MLVELPVVLEREIEAIMRSAALLAGQRRAGDQQSGLQYIGCLVSTAITRLRHCGFMAVSSATTCFKSLSVAYDSDVLPHHRLHFLDELLGLAPSFRCPETAELVAAAAGAIR